MRPVLLASALAAALCAASPALACRITPPAVLEEARAPRVTFTAVVVMIERDMVDDQPNVDLTLRSLRPLAGKPPPSVIVGGFLDDVIVVGCGPVRPMPEYLAQIPVGAEVVVSGVEMQAGVLTVQVVEPVESERGRALLATAETRSGR